jgi:sialic acid synthase SpsE
VIEKHFTLDKTMAGPDHKASLEPDELAVLVRSVRNVEAALGDGVKRPAPEEEKIRPLVRKSLVSARDLKRGEALSKEMIAYKRPGTGISPAEAFLYIGRLIKRNIPADTVIKPDFLE